MNGTTGGKRPRPGPRYFHIHKDLNLDILTFISYQGDNEGEDPLLVPLLSLVGVGVGALAMSLLLLVVLLCYFTGKLPRTK